MKAIKLLGPAILAIGLAGYAMGQAPVGRPQTGGPLPQDLDTISLPLTASTTHTQAAATLCTQTVCYVATATAGDGIAIRQCSLPVMRVTVVNGSGAAIQIYGSGTDTIDGVATATGVSLPAATTLKTGVVELVCVVGGTGAKWFSH